jgi:hypothetical protein
VLKISNLEGENMQWQGCKIWKHIRGQKGNGIVHDGNGNGTGFERIPIDWAGH